MRGSVGSLLMNAIPGRAVITRGNGLRRVLVRHPPLLVPLARRLVGMI